MLISRNEKKTSKKTITEDAVDPLTAELSVALPAISPVTHTTNKRVFFKRQDIEAHLRSNDQSSTSSNDNVTKEDRKTQLQEEDIEAILSSVSSYNVAVGKIMPPHLQKFQINNKSQGKIGTNSSQT